MAEINISKQYPFDPDFHYECRLERINLDKEREDDLMSGNGFIISEPSSIKKDINNGINTIFSTRYGQTLQDVNAFADRYKCKCGHLKSRINHGIKCPICGERVKFLDDDFSYFGWIVIRGPYYLIHPNLYKSLEFLIGASKLTNIIRRVDEKDIDGFSISRKKDDKKLAQMFKNKSMDQILREEPFFGIGMISFKERIEEILEFYINKSPNKYEYYNDIMTNMDKLFIQSVPVYTTHLRPFRVEGEKLVFEGTNTIYNIMAKLAAELNRNSLRISKSRKPKEQLLFEMQNYYNELYKEIETGLAQKKGIIRQLFGGRYNFTSRSVIVPGPDLRIDQVRLPYHALVELLQQTIINLLQKTYGYSYSEAYKTWYKAQIKQDPKVKNIIELLIKDTPNGIPVLINRNPSINYGSIMQMYVVGINDNFTMSVPLQILKPLGADFDGDTLNILYLINKAFAERAERIFNPRNAMYISRNDGRFNNDINFARDAIINANAMINLSREKYSKEQIAKIMALKNIV